MGGGDLRRAGSEVGTFGVFDDEIFSPCVFSFTILSRLASLCVRTTRGRGFQLTTNFPFFLTPDLPITTCNTRPRRRRFSPSHRPPSSPRQLFDLPNGLILPNLNALQSFRYPPVTSSEVLTTSSLVLRRLDWDRCSSSLSHGLGKDAFEGGRRGTAEEGSREPGMLAQQDVLSTEGCCF